MEPWRSCKRHYNGGEVYTHDLKIVKGIELVAAGNLELKRKIRTKGPIIKQTSLSISEIIKAAARSTWKTKSRVAK